VLHLQSEDEERLLFCMKYDHGDSIPATGRHDRRDVFVLGTGVYYRDQSIPPLKGGPLTCVFLSGPETLNFQECVTC
jgi:hypothetical protein